MTITVPKSCRHPGLSIEEVEAYYSLTPLPQSSVSPGYDYDKTISNILNIYLSTKQHSSASAKGVKKFRLKQACQADESVQKKSRIFRDFNCWRLAQISKYCNNEDLDYDDTAYLKEKLAKAELKIRQLKAENKSLKLQLRGDNPKAQTAPPVDIDKSKAVKLKEPKPVVVKKEPDCEAVEPVVVDIDKSKAVEPVKTVEFKAEVYYKYDENFDTDEERIRHYYNRCHEVQKTCEEMYIVNHNCCEGYKSKYKNDILDLYTDWCDEELEELLGVIEDPCESVQDQLENRHYNMLNSQLRDMTRRAD